MDWNLFIAVSRIETLLLLSSLTLIINQLLLINTRIIPHIGAWVASAAHQRRSRGDDGGSSMASVTKFKLTMKG